MKLRIKIAVGLAIAAALIGGAIAMERGCDGGYDVSIHVVPSADPAHPCVVQGSFRGCGFRRLLMSRSDFQLMPAKGVPSEISGRNGNTSLRMRAGLSDEDPMRVWYVATVERNAKIVASKSAVLNVRR